ncbi:MAG: hypothetical protein KBD01_09125 [Acidobacteria bacterium]|nr:hypothetical protein [Acidobacteriota bacterium]
MSARRIVAALLFVALAPASPALAADTGAWAHALAGQDAQAEEEFAASLSADPGDLSAAIGLAALMEGRNETGDALGVLVAALRGRTDAPLAAGALARVLALTTRAPDGGATAIPLLREIAGGAPVADPEVRSLATLALADCLSRSGDPAAARELLAGSGRIVPWTLIGPFGRFPDLDLYREMPPERGELSVADAAPGPDGLPPFRIDTTFADGRPVVPPQFRTTGVVFAVADLVAESAATVRARVMSPASFRVFVDGREALAADRARERPADALAFRLQLAPGRHRLLVKLTNSARFTPLSVALEPAADSVRAVPVAGEARGESRAEPAPCALDAAANAAGASDPAQLLAAAWWLRARGLDRDSGALLERAVKAHPAANLFAYALGEHLRNTDTGSDAQTDYSRARGLLSRLVAEGSTWRGARLLVASMDEEAERQTEAWQGAEQVLAAAPGDADALLIQHRIAVRREWRAEAADRIERARAAAPGRTDVLRSAIEFYRAQRTASALAAALAESAARNPLDEDWPEFLGASGRVDEARAAWERLIAERPSHFAAYVGLARLLADAGKPAEALAAIDRAGALYPQESFVPYQRASFLSRLGREDEARKELQRALELAPGRLELREALRRRGEPDVLGPWLVDPLPVIREARRPAPGVDSALLGDLATILVDNRGGQTELYQGIHAVYTRAGVEREGELEVLPNSRLLGIRIHKPDGRTVDVASGTQPPISLPGLAPGDAIEYSWRRYTPPSQLVPGALDNRTVFMFQGEDRAFALSRYVVLHDERLPVEVCGNEEGLETTDEVKSGLRIRTWTARSMPQLRPEPHVPDPLALIPHVKLGLGVTWQDIGDIVKSALAGMLHPDPPLPEIAEEIRRAAGGDDPLALARELHRVVGQRLRPGGPPLALGTPASVSASAGEGNRLTVALAVARLLGLPARLILARPIELKGQDLGCPSPEEFPYALLELTAGGRVVYLDYTEANFPFDSIPARIAGSDALAVPLEPERPAEIVTLESRETGILHDIEADLVLQADGRVSGKLSITGHGQLASVLRRVLGEVPADELPNVYRTLAGQQFPGAEVTSYASQGTEQREGDVTLTMDIRGGGFGRRTPTGIAIPIVHKPIDLLGEYASLPERRHPLLLDPQLYERDRIRLAIPEGLQVAELPVDATVESPFGKVGISARREGPRLLLERVAVVPPRRVEPSEYGALRGWAQRLDDAQRGEITLQLPIR